MKKLFFFYLLLATVFFITGSVAHAQSPKSNFCDFSNDGKNYSCYIVDTNSIRPADCPLIGGSLNGGFSCAKVPAGYTPPVMDVSINISPLRGTAGVTNPTITWSAPSVASDPTTCTSTGTSNVNTGNAPQGSVQVGVLPAADAEQGNIAETFVYEITCKNSVTSGKNSVSIVADISSGTCAISNDKANYACTGGEKPTTCSAQGGIFYCPKVPSGYTLSGFGVSVSVNPTQGQVGTINPTISWSAPSAASDPTICGGTEIGNSRPASGTFSVGIINSAGSQKYTVTCRNSGGTASGFSTVTVSAVKPITTQTNSGTRLGYQPLEPLPGLDHVENLNFASFLGVVFRLLITAGALLAVITLVYAGVSYMLSGAFETMGEAKNRMKAAVFGLIILLGAWLMLNTINPALLNFNLNLPGGSGVSGQGASNPTVITQSAAQTQQQIAACEVTGKHWHSAIKNGTNCY